MPCDTACDRFEVPYRYGSESRRYRPDFIVLADDGRGKDDLLRLVAGSVEAMIAKVAEAGVR
jgi:hypothetical protein